MNLIELTISAESGEAYAAAAELSAMAITLNELVSQFKYEKN